MNKEINPKLNYRFKNRILFKYNILIFWFFITINFFIPKISNNNSYLLIDSKFSSITLKVKGFGNKDVFSRSYFENEYYPDMVYINGIKQSKVNCGYDFNQTENFVELVWNNSINNCENMFRECSDIIEIDMSNFDTSQITMMLYMFYGCSSLKFLNLSNFNTSQVVSMHSMFYGCSSLISLNLSSFNTSLVTTMAHMFHGCSSLISLNLSNFDTSLVLYMSYMFYNCSSLISLNLSNFKNSKVESMYGLFSWCTNLQYINLHNIDGSKSGSYNSMFYNIQPNFVICIKETDNNEILSEIKNKNCSINYCFDDWKSKQKKLINGTNECIDNCGNELEYKYEYNNKCYQHCPYGNVSLSNNQCKCELNK